MRAEPSVRLPPRVVPILEATLRSPLVARGTPLEIWRAEDHRTWVDSFMELGIRLFNSGILDQGLPLGYSLVADLFDWEAQCQLSGWHAFSNRRETVARIIEAYAIVGLAGEADALKAAFSEWNSSETDNDAISAAYASVHHEYSVDLDRLEYLVCFFVDNADRLFYVPAAA
jgi:hypothetical protein